MIQHPLNFLLGVVSLMHTASAQFDDCSSEFSESAGSSLHRSDFLDYTITSACYLAYADNKNQREAVCENDLRDALDAGEWSFTEDLPVQVQNFFCKTACTIWDDYLDPTEGDTPCVQAYNSDDAFLCDGLNAYQTHNIWLHDLTYDDAFAYMTSLCSNMTTVADNELVPMIYDEYGALEPYVCENRMDWLDSEEYSCEDYESEGWCGANYKARYSDFSNYRGSDNLTALDACCVCENFESSSGICKNIVEWVDSDEYSCEDYESEGWCGENYKARYGNFDDYAGTYNMTALDACCVCKDFNISDHVDEDTCQDKVDWKDSAGEDCDDYTDKEYCGRNYEPKWKDFSDFRSDDGISALEACCICHDFDWEGYPVESDEMPLPEPASASSGSGGLDGGSIAAITLAVLCAVIGTGLFAVKRRQSLLFADVEELKKPSVEAIFNDDNIDKEMTTVTIS